MPPVKYIEPGRECSGVSDDEAAYRRSGRHSVAMECVIVPKSQETSPESSALTERDKQWVAEAAAWARATGVSYFNVPHHRAGIHTAVDVMHWLDARTDVPVYWVRWMGDYRTRYQLVRNALQSLVNGGYLTTGTTVNDRNRESVCYSRAPDIDDWTVEVSPAPESERVSELVRSWIRTHKADLKGIESITITHRKHQVHVVEAGGDGKVGRARTRRRGPG